MEGGVKGEIDYNIKIFNRYSNFIIIVFDIRNKIRNLNNLRKFLKYGRNNNSIINANIFIKSVTNII